jgi:two-component system, sensor histidine kinase PdtaS
MFSRIHANDRRHPVTLPHSPYPPSSASHPTGELEVARAMRALGRGCLSTRVACPAQCGPEDLSRSFNEMAGRLEKEIEHRKRLEEKLAASLHEKEVLLREVHHRVKNNLQVVSSFLELQSARLADPAAREICRESRQRIRSMALIHEGLYRNRDLSTVRMDRYVQHLTADLIKTYGRGDGGVLLTAVVDPGLDLPVDTVTPAGLILNELVSNALKHAFPDGRKGRIHVEFIRQEDDSYRLTVGDDGVGFPTRGTAPPRPGASLGMKLVTMLAHQMGGKIEVKGGKGATFILTFPPARAETAG